MTEKRAENEFKVSEKIKKFILKNRLLHELLILSHAIFGSVNILCIVNIFFKREGEILLKYEIFYSKY